MENREVSGVRRAITWLHHRATEMNDPHAAQVLNAAAFNLGNQLERWRSGGLRSSAAQLSHSTAQIEREQNGTE